MTFSYWIMVLITSSAGAVVIPGHYTSSDTCIEARKQMQEVSEANTFAVCVPIETWNANFNSRSK